jgi:hypothetical protein
VVLSDKDFRKLNINLLCQWKWKIETEECIWQDLIKAKLLQGRPITLVKRIIDDPLYGMI